MSGQLVHLENEDKTGTLCGLTYGSEQLTGTVMDDPDEAGDVTCKKCMLEHLRGEIRAERISWGELFELQGLAEHIEPGDVELLEWAGVPEFPDEDADSTSVLSAPRGTRSSMFKLEIETANAAFHDEDGNEDAGREVARMLEDAASRLREGESSGSLRDINGNGVGTFWFEAIE